MTAELGEPLSDGVLVARAQRGVAGARDELARRYRQPAFLFAYQLLGNRDDALDVAQDAMVRFFGALGRFDSGRPVLPWLFRIVRNRAIDVRRRTRPTESLDDGSAPPLEPVTAPDASPEALAGQRQLRERVWRAVGELSRKQREVLVLRDYQDLSYGEIAAVLGIPRGTVMSRLHGARSALRRRVMASMAPPAADRGTDHD